MDQSKFLEAQQAYDAGDFRTAAKSFLASAGKGAAGNGAAYHMAGNSLMRLRRHQDALTVYGHALRDDTYDKRGAIHANMGAAYSAIGEYADAVKSYAAALDEPDYASNYKAYQGMASALCERGRVEEAAVAYRKAALDTTNPDPGKALVNLGLCFMALGRPGDAVEAYKAALGFDAYQGRGKALANLGQAYTALGEYTEAVRAFEKSTQLHGHKLSPSAQGAYDTALAAVRPAHETVDGWETGEMPPALAEAQPSGWDTGELQALTGQFAAEPAGTFETAPLPMTGSFAADPEPQHFAQIYDTHADGAADALGMGDDHAVNDFFALSEQDMKVRDREMRREQRAQRNAEGGWVKTAIGVVVAVLLVGAALGAAYYFGFGWPMQTTTVKGLMSAYASGQPYERYWVAVPGKDIEREMSKIPPVKEFTVDDVVAGPTVSSAKITVTPEKGAPLHYTVTLTREGVGWRVSGVENEWRSTGGS